MVIEGHCPVEIGQGNLQAFRYGSEGLLRQVSVTIVEGVEDREEGGGLTKPLG
jgi:hypothetical protein